MCIWQAPQGAYPSHTLQSAGDLGGELCLCGKRAAGTDLRKKKGKGRLHRVTLAPGKIVHRLQQRLLTERFTEGALRPQRCRNGQKIHTTGLTASGDRNDLHARIHSLQGMNGFHALVLRHQEVGNHKIHRGSQIVIQPFAAVAGLDDFIALPFEELSERGAERGVVIDNQNTCHDVIASACFSQARVLWALRKSGPPPSEPASILQDPTPLAHLIVSAGASTKAHFPSLSTPRTLQGREKDVG